MREFNTIAEAASYLGVSEMYIRRHIKKGFIDSCQQGYTMRLKASEVDVFLLPYNLV
jgi:excisionase family DNA binding protein